MHAFANTPIINRLRNNRRPQRAVVTPGDPFTGDLHGVLIHRNAWQKHPDDAFTPAREITLAHRHRVLARNAAPIQMELPRSLSGGIWNSNWAQPDELTHEQAAHKLWDQGYIDFHHVADEATRRHLGVSGVPHRDFTHFKGLGHYEGAIEPSLMTAFHKPISNRILQAIGSDVGSWARQLQTLAFAVHPAGKEKLLHMRIATHHRGDMSVNQLASISNDVSNKFGTHINENGKPTIPGLTILPDNTGFSDVLTYIPHYEDNPRRVEDAFRAVAESFGGAGSLKYWPGTGADTGTDPVPDKTTANLTDPERRDRAQINYALDSGKHGPQRYRFPLDAPTHSVPTEAVKMALDRELIRQVDLAPMNSFPLWTTMAKHLKDEGFDGYHAAILSGQPIGWEARSFINSGPNAVQGNALLSSAPSPGRGSPWHVYSSLPDTLRHAWQQPHLWTMLRHEPHTNHSMLLLSGISNHRNDQSHGTLLLHLNDPHVAAKVVEDMHAHNSLHGLESNSFDLHTKFFGGRGRAFSDDLPRREGSLKQMSLDASIIAGATNRPHNDLRNYWGPFADHMIEEGFTAIPHAIIHGTPIPTGVVWPTYSMGNLDRIRSAGGVIQPHDHSRAQDGSSRYETSLHAFATFHPSAGLDLIIGNGGTYGKNFEDSGQHWVHLTNAEHIRDVVDELHGAVHPGASGVVKKSMDAFKAYVHLHTDPEQRAFSGAAQDDPVRMAHSPAGTGIVVQGVYYKPGKMIPKIEVRPQARKTKAKWGPLATKMLGGNARKTRVV